MSRYLRWKEVVVAVSASSDLKLSVSLTLMAVKNTFIKQSRIYSNEILSPYDLWQQGTGSLQNRTIMP